MRAAAVYCLRESRRVGLVGGGFGPCGIRRTTVNMAAFMTDISSRVEVRAVTDAGLPSRGPEGVGRT